MQNVNPFRQQVVDLLQALGGEHLPEAVLLESNKIRIGLVKILREGETLYEGFPVDARGNVSRYGVTITLGGHVRGGGAVSFIGLGGHVPSMQMDREQWLATVRNVGTAFLASMNELVRAREVGPLKATLETLSHLEVEVGEVTERDRLLLALQGQKAWVVAAAERSGLRLVPDSIGYLRRFVNPRYAIIEPGEFDDFTSAQLVTAGLPEAAAMVLRMEGLRLAPPPLAAPAPAAEVKAEAKAKTAVDGNVREPEAGAGVA